MKILYHHRTAAQDGQAVHIHEMIASLRELGHEVRIVGPSSSGTVEMGSKIGWIDRLKASLPAALYELLELAYSLVAYRRLAKAVLEFQPDVIYERYNLYLLAGLMVKRRFDLPLLLETNAPLVYERSRFGRLALKRLAGWAERTVWQGADQVLPVTRALAEHVTRAGVPEERVTVIPNGVNEAHFASAPGPDAAKLKLGLADATVLGFTGFVRDWHGVDRILRWMAAPGVPQSVHLLVVGDGPARPDLERLAAELSLTNRVIFTGVVSRERIPEYVAAFDIALQPAVVEYASPLKLFEYLASGKAIVAPRQPNLEEVLVDGKNVLFFDASDPNALAGALNTLLGDPELRQRLAAGAAATIRERRLTWLDSAKRVSVLCERLRNRAPDDKAYRCQNAD